MLTQALVHQILKLYPAHFESIGAGVRKIIGNVVDVRLLGIHSASRAVESSNHFFIPPFISIRGRL
jgi:hypothetical protein